jgi:signal-transduction protein with cAMP-binding, CBS, and nucleotidyltransferase domain
VRDAVEKMVSAGVACLLVPDDGDPAAGIVTKRDVVTKVVGRGLDAGEVTVGEIVSVPVTTIEPDAIIEDCSSRMLAEGVRRFPVREGGGVIGIVSDSDILAAVEGHRWWGRRGRRWPNSHIVADVMQPVPDDMKLDVEDGVVPELSVWECAARLAHAPAHRLPVVQEGRAIGVVSETDILRALEERGGAD